MTNADQPAFPDPLRGAEQTYSNQKPSENPVGLTKREYFAAMAMQGIIASDVDQNISSKTVAMSAVAQADELLRQLETK